MHTMITANAVLSAEFFNTSIFKPSWVIEHGLLAQEDIQGDYLFTSEMAQFATRTTQFLIVPNRLQISLTTHDEQGPGEMGLTVDMAIEEIKPKVETVLNELPHTPYKALGLNFAYIGNPDTGESPLELLRRVFYRPGTRFMDRLAEHDFSIGSFVLQKWQNSSVKVEIKPTRYSQRETREPKQAILLDFNFHFDAGDDAQVVFRDALSVWRDAESHASELVRSLMES